MIDKSLHTRLEEINTKLTAIEKNIMNTAIRLDTNLQQELSDHIEGIYDYELEVNIDCYVGDDLLCTLEELLKGCSTRSRYKWGLADGNNHNEFEHRKNQPMKDDRHCWLFHCLYDHVPLSWEKIAEIERFFINIKPRYQYQFDVQ
jgi:hypothetical protein